MQSRLYLSPEVASGSKYDNINVIHDYEPRRERLKAIRSRALILNRAGANSTPRATDRSTTAKPRRGKLHAGSCNARGAFVSFQLYKRYGVVGNGIGYAQCYSLHRLHRQVHSSCSEESAGLEARSRPRANG